MRLRATQCIPVLNVDCPVVGFLEFLRNMVQLHLVTTLKSSKVLVNVIGIHANLLIDVVRRFGSPSSIFNGRILKQTEASEGKALILQAAKSGRPLSICDA